MAKLENWSLITINENEFVAPEMRERVLLGNVYDREGFDNGERVRTSLVQEIDVCNNMAYTINTIYELGEPSKEYKDFWEELKSEGV